MIPEALGRSARNAPGAIWTPKKIEILDQLYERFNHRSFVSPDPLEFLYGYADPLDREIVALIASSLAFGRVAQIRKSITIVLKEMGSPSLFLAQRSPEDIREIFRGFRHRFADGGDLASLLMGMQRAVQEYGSLRRLFARSYRTEGDSVQRALGTFVGFLGAACPGTSALLPSPALGSPCKRLHLFLRWMVRRDEVDPGGWDDVSASHLIIPLDTHMYSTGCRMGLIGQKSPSLRATMEMTEAFRCISPEDPVKYDFALTRLGILDLEEKEDVLRALADS